MNTPTTTATEQAAYLYQVEAAHRREPVRTLALLYARTAAALTPSITMHPTSRAALAALKLACEAAGITAPTRGEVKDAVLYLRRRGLAAPWWRVAIPGPSKRPAHHNAEGVTR